MPANGKSLKVLIVLSLRSKTHNTFRSSTAPPPTCPAAEADCSGEPSNPYTCGANKCPYNTVCELESAGFDLKNDCCQDSRSNSACPSNIAPVSCGPPGGKQCGYSNQCLADSSGYNSNQCCAAVPDGVACPSINAPVECGSIPCVYNSICEAEAAGATDCCPQVPSDTICTGENMPVKCGSCEYANQCLADAAGATDCCKAVPEDTICTLENMPVKCGSCEYANQCLADAAGATDCCKAVPEDVACTANYEPVTCGADKCTYSNQCLADAAGATDCCRNPIDEGCTQNFDPVECGKNRCYYVNECVAKKSGYDPESCVPGQGSMFPTPTPPAITTFGTPENVQGGSSSGNSIVKIGIGCLVSTVVAFLLV